MSGIFISYRREDSRADAGRLSKDLKEHLDENQIFRDIDTVAPGVDFVNAIESGVASCDALIAIIGPNWLSIRDKNGRLRLEDSDDYVRVEIGTALERDTRVIPVLVGGASMPMNEELPDSLAPLTRRQAHELSESRWDFDVEQLAKALMQIPGIRARKPSQPNAEIADAPNRQKPAPGFGRFIGAGILSTMGLLFLVAGLIEGQGLAFFWAVVFFGGAYWLFAKR